MSSFLRHTIGVLYEKISSSFSTVQSKPERTEALINATETLCKSLKFYERKRSNFGTYEFKKFCANHKNEAKILLDNGLEFDTIAEFVTKVIKLDKEGRLNFILSVEHRHSQWSKELQETHGMTQGQNLESTQQKVDGDIPKSDCSDESEDEFLDSLQDKPDDNRETLGKTPMYIDPVNRNKYHLTANAATNTNIKEPKILSFADKSDTKNNKIHDWSFPHAESTELHDGNEDYKHLYDPETLEQKVKELKRIETNDAMSEMAAKIESLEKKLLAEKSKSNKDNSYYGQCKAEARKAKIRQVPFENDPNSSDSDWSQSDDEDCLEIPKFFDS